MSDKPEAACFALFGALLGGYSVFKLHDREPWALSPALFPLLVAGAFMLLGILLFAQGKSKKAEKAPDKWLPATPWANRRQVFICLLTLFYIILLPVLHFFPATLLYSALFIFVSGERRAWALAITPLCVSAGFYALFTEIFTIVMP